MRWNYANLCIIKTIDLFECPLSSNHNFWRLRPYKRTRRPWNVSPSRRSLPLLRRRRSFEVPWKGLLLLRRFRIITMSWSGRLRFARHGFCLFMDNTTYVFLITCYQNVDMTMRSSMQEENRILEKTNRQKVVEVEKLSQTIQELEEAILAGGATANAIRDYQRQISELNVCAFHIFLGVSVRFWWRKTWTVWSMIQNLAGREEDSGEGTGEGKSIGE